jgi:phosphoribosyl-AMP cyclohydrolase
MSELSTGGPGSSPPSPSQLDGALAGLRFDDAGLLPAVVQDDRDGAVLMVAWMDAEAVRRTLTTGRTWFWSRSRRRHWQKGETSGHVQHVRSVTADCDGDTVLVRVEQVGPACHTGTRSCFSHPLGTGS